MRKKILMLTTIYPSPDFTLLNSTNVCHYFAKEWVELGYEVKVIFNYPVYSKIVHKIADLLGNRVASIGQSYFITKRITDVLKYEMDGVSISRIPLYKALPKLAVKSSVLNKQVQLIQQELNKEDFIPDVIVSHFCYPHLEMMAQLKDIYGSKTTIVNHIQSLPLKRFIGSHYKDYFKKIDVWGFRSSNIKKEFEKQFGFQHDTFICYSGVPKEYIQEKGKQGKSKITNFVYVGSLIARKHPIQVLYGLEKSKSLDKYSLTYVGEGVERNKIQKSIDNSSLRGLVDLKGNLKRIEVLNCLDQADCFIMISQGETFGLVYLEAMGRGLITIASKGEGMDEIIKDGENGFFCSPGNPNELAKVIDRINALSVNERTRISENAIKTAKQFSDKAVAVNYLNAIT